MRCLHDPWVGTVLLATKQRLMGLQIGHRVQTDHFRCSQHDLIQVGTNCAFGSGVCLAPTDRIGSKEIVVDDNANVTDRCVLKPGVHLLEGAVLGSCSLGCKDAVFPRCSVSTGNVGGKSLLLRTRSADEADSTYKFLPPKERELVLEALRRHNSTMWHYGFNFATIAFAFIDHPFDAAMQYAALPAAWVVVGNLVPTAVCILKSECDRRRAPFLFLFQLAFTVVLKWMLIGQWEEGAHAFYGYFHYCFTVLMLRFEKLEMMCPYFDMLKALAMGANVRDRTSAVLQGNGFEFDLLYVEEEVCTNKDVDVTCHTVENMLLRFAPVKYHKGSAVYSHSCVMPGGAIGIGGLLREFSQVLKGEAIPPGETYAGLPAVHVSEAELKQRETEQEFARTRVLGRRNSETTHFFGQMEVSYGSTGTSIEL